MRWLILGLVVVLGGCSSPRLFEKTNNEIGIKYEKGSIVIASEKVDADFVNLSDLLIDRTLYRENGGQLLAYEYARCIPPYTFRYSMKTSLRIIFGSVKVMELGRKGNMGLYAVIFKNGGCLYTIAVNENKKALSMAYGIRKEQIGNVALKLGISMAPAFEKMGEGVTLTLSSEVFLSRWSPKMVIMDGLLQSTGGSFFVSH